MKDFKSFFYPSLAGIFFLVLLIACQKGDPIAFDRYIKLNLEAFYEDTSLYTTVSFADSLLVADPAVKNGGEVYSLGAPAELPRVAGDSGRLQITIVKKNYSNIEFDSIIPITNINDFLLVQLDPTQRPLLINKRTVSEGLTPPAIDSVSVRFYFSSSDPTIRNPNFSPSRTVTKVDLELWALKEVNGSLEPVNLNRKIRLSANELTNEYYSFKRNESYAWRILDISPGVPSNKRVVESFEYDPSFEGFTRGFIELHNGSSDLTLFQTIKITQSFDPFMYMPGINGKYLFGFEK